MIDLVPIGSADNNVLKILGQRLRDIFKQNVHISKNLALPQQSWNEKRRQYLSNKLLSSIPPQSGLQDRTLGIADVDIYTPGLNFIFGEAVPVERKAIISLARLRQEFYSLPPNENLFIQRVVKEAVHELGHTYGLRHCTNSNCVMHFSNTIHDTDVKGWHFCTRCQARINQTR